MGQSTFDGSCGSASYRVRKGLNPNPSQESLDLPKYECLDEDDVLERLSNLAQTNIELNQDRSIDDTVEFDVDEFLNGEYEGHISEVDVCGSEDEDVSLLYWYNRLVHPPKSYKKFLDYLSKKNLKSYPALGQFTGFKAWVHPNGSRLILPKTNTEKYNPADKFQSIRSSASRTAKQLTNLRWLPSSNENKKCLLNLELTFPSEVNKELKNGFEKDKDKFWDVYKQFQEKLGHSFSSANLHLWSSSNPISPNAHFHSSMVWADKIEVDGSEVDGGFLKPKDWSEKGQPVSSSKFKALWSECVNGQFGTSYCEDRTAYKTNSTWVNAMASDGEVKPIVVNISWVPLSKYSWSAQQKEHPQEFIKKKIIHRLKYCRRKPLTDLGEYYFSNDFNQEDIDLGFCSDLVDYHNSSRQFGGWTRLTNCVNLQSDEDGEDKKMCPVCGADCSVEHLSPSEYSPDRLVSVGKRGSVYYSDPPDNQRINLNTKPAIDGSDDVVDEDDLVEDLEEDDFL